MIAYYIIVGFAFLVIVYYWGWENGKRFSSRDQKLANQLLDDRLRSIAKHARTCYTCKEHLSLDLWEWFEDLERKE